MEKSIRRESPRHAGGDRGTLSLSGARGVPYGFLVFTVLFTGAGVIMLEVLGARLAGPIFGVSLYIWTALIAVTLASLAVGYFVGGRLCDRFPSADTMYLLILAAGLWIGFIPVADGQIMKMCYEYLGMRMGVLTAATFLFGPPLTLLGMVSPYALKLALADLHKTGRTAGGLYAISTVGSVAGTILAGYGLIPGIGLSYTLIVIMGVILTPAIAWFAMGRRWPMLAASGILSVLGFWLAFTSEASASPGPGIVSQVKKDSLYGQIKVIDRYSDNTRWMLLEGTAQTGMYLTDAEGAKNKIVSDYAKVISNFLRFHGPEGKRALLVGLGGGALVRPLLEAGYDLDIVEIDPTIAEFAQKYFYLPSKDPETGEENYHLIHDDGRAYIRRAEEKYDVILFDVFSGGGQPFHLFSKEAFEETKRILAPGGMVALNCIAVPDGPKERLAASLLRTIGEVFSERQVYTAYLVEPGELNNILMFFSNDPFADAGDPEDLDEESRESWDYMEKRVFPLDADKGSIITDDWNPVDRWTAQVNELWRVRLFESFGKSDILTY